MAFGSRKRVLLVGSEGVALFGPGARGIEREIALSWEVPNFDQQLIEALAEKNHNSPVLVLFDGADQTYRKEENIPKLSFFDRPRFVKRKLDLAFPSYPIRASILIKPIKQNHKSLREAPSYLFVAIPETERLDKIGADMLEAGVPVAGFGLLPAESEGLVTLLSEKVFGKEGKKSRWSVLISQHETGGLRQVVVKDGRLALTRMTPTSEAGTQGPAWVEEVMREFKATLTYIARFGYVADDGLDVITVCGDIEKQFFDQKSLPVTNFQCMKVTDALAAIGAKGSNPGEANLADALHAAWAAKKRSLAVPVQVPSINRIMAPRFGARMGTIFLMLTLLTMGGFAFVEYQDYVQFEGEIEQKQHRRTTLQSQYESESKVFDALPVKPLVVKNALAVKGFLDSKTVNIKPTLNVLRKALENDIRLKQLTFEYHGSIKIGATETPLVRISFKMTIPSIATLEQKVLRAEGLVAILQTAFPGYDVRIKSQFGNVSRTGRFEGSSGKTSEATTTKDDTAEFELQGVPL